MSLYEIDFTFTEPGYGTIELTAEAEEVEEEALKHIQMSYPEAEDIEIIETRILD